MPAAAKTEQVLFSYPSSNSSVDVNPLSDKNVVDDLNVAVPDVTALDSIGVKCAVVKDISHVSSPGEGWRKNLQKPIDNPTDFRIMQG
jgi:hypothetical protein